MPIQATDGDGLGRIVDDLHCAGCGYNLRTLAWDAECPECAIPAVDSRVPAGFQFRSRRAASRILWGVAMLAVASLTATLQSIAFTALNYYGHIPRTPGFFLTAVHFLFVVALGAHAIEFVAVVVIASRFGARLDGRRWLRFATIAAAAISLFGFATFLIAYFSWGWTSLRNAPPGVKAAWMISWQFRAISLILLVIVLAAFVDRAKNYRLRMLCLLLTVPTTLKLLDDIVLGFFDYSGGTRGWDYLGLGLWWRQYVDAACGIVILAVLWLFIRRLSRGLRQCSAEH